MINFVEFFIEQLRALEWVIPSMREYFYPSPPQTAPPPPTARRPPPPPTTSAALADIEWADYDSDLGNFQKLGGHLTVEVVSAEEAKEFERKKYFMNPHGWQD